MFYLVSPNLGCGSGPFLTSFPYGNFRRVQTFYNSQFHHLIHHLLPVPPLPYAIASVNLRPSSKFQTPSLPLLRSIRLRASINSSNHHILHLNSVAMAPSPLPLELLEMIALVNHLLPRSLPYVNDSIHPCSSFPGPPGAFGIFHRHKVYNHDSSRVYIVWLYRLYMRYTLAKHRYSLYCSPEIPVAKRGTLLFFF
jgi:hypothetical protein